MKTENMTDTPIYLALNMSKVLNSEESFNLMNNVGPRVCITTAAHPGFVGFQANIQTGILPFAGRYGGGNGSHGKGTESHPKLSIYHVEEMGRPR
jgi:hypothetical protein